MALFFFGEQEEVAAAQFAGCFAQPPDFPLPGFRVGGVHADLDDLPDGEPLLHDKIRFDPVRILPEKEADFSAKLLAEKSDGHQVFKEAAPIRAERRAIA